jgi:hypothetical protein
MYYMIDKDRSTATINCIPQFTKIQNHHLAPTNLNEPPVLICR